MSKSESPTNIKVPDYEIQAILFSILETNFYSSDLFRLIDIHKDDDGELGGVSSSAKEFLAHTGVTVLNRQLDLMERLSDCLGIDSSIIDTTRLSIHDPVVPGKPISTAYKESLEMEASKSVRLPKSKDEAT